MIVLFKTLKQLANYEATHNQLCQYKFNIDIYANTGLIFI